MVFGPRRFEYQKYFEKVNKNYGYQIGDSLLKRLANTFSDSPIPWIRLSEDVEKGQWKQVSVEEAAELFNDGLALFVDAREAKEFKIGHIPGAINLPAEEFQQYYQDYAEWLPVDVPLVVYCQGDPCDESRTVLTYLKNFGHEDLILFPGGWLEWERGRIQESGVRMTEKKGEG